MELEKGQFVYIRKDIEAKKLSKNGGHITPSMLDYIGKVAIIIDIVADNPPEEGLSLSLAIKGESVGFLWGESDVIPITKGTKVKIREDLEAGHIYGNMFAYPEMLRYCGCNAEILGTDGLTNIRTCLPLSIDKGYYAWTPEMLEFLPPIETEEDKPEVFNKHYEQMGIQPIEVMQQAFSPEEFKGYLKGNILKYTMRAGKKQGEAAEKDLAKLNVYSKWLEEFIARGAINLV